jgi:N-acetylneuraminic acid mutarotase
LGSPLPQAQGGLAAAAINNQLFAFGGEYFSARGFGVHAEAWCYEPAKDSWSAVSPMVTPRHGLGAVSDGTVIYALGGATRPGTMGTSQILEVFYPK